MIGIARGRLTQFDTRAQVQLTDGSPSLAAADSTFDRFVANYVLDLLPPEDIAMLLVEARRILTPDGRLCLVSLTHGVTQLSRFVSSAWEILHRLRPALVGGCRPIELLEFVAESEWKVDHRNVVINFGIPSEVLVASKNP
jgi:ubiquinone/menaquinone biosynthesis C-methylase UbiE